MSPQHQRLQSLNTILLIAFAVIAFALLYWTVRAPSLLAREDNPRLVEAEFRIQRGRILDSRDVVLAENAGTLARVKRVYPIPEIGAAVGYYSLRFGTAGVEGALDDVLRGEGENAGIFLRQQFLHEPQIGHDVRLTLNADWQVAAEQLLGDQAGAVLVMGVTDGAIRVMVSHPTYDPNSLDENFEALVADESAPLLNRVTQGQYQPGATLDPLIRAFAYSQAIGTPETTLPELATGLGANGIQAAYEVFGLTELPAFIINTATATTTTPADFTAVFDPVRAARGQENLSITPLQLGLAYAALANGGNMPTPRLVSAVHTTANTWQSYPRPEPVPILPAEMATLALQNLNRQNNAWQMATLTLSGPDGVRNAWFVALAPLENPQVAVIIIIEDSDQPAQAAMLGEAMLDRIFSPE
jgi:peptidoglycan glycosyltransferase